MVEETASTARETISVQELIESPDPLPLVAPFVLGTPCITPNGEQGSIVSDSLILEGPDGRGGTRQFIASYWQEAGLHLRRGASLCPQSTLEVRVGSNTQRFHAGELRIVTRRDLIVRRGEH